MSWSTLAAVMLGAAFLVAGGSKVAAGPAWAAQARELGAPGFVVPILPWVEIAVGAALITSVGQVVAAVVAAVLLLAFTALIVGRLAQGRHPPCACFGAWSATPIGWRHVARNAVLIALAVVVLAG
jgi:uncharacterized membrane protein YphA (DoxX/SURF4 family)